MDTLLYFAYGSNMSTPRLLARARSARAVTIARLDAHRLMFHKQGKDGSGKCDITLTRNPADAVYGVVFQIATVEKLALDQTEGLGMGYDEKMVSVITQHGEVLKAVSYYATDINHLLKPHHWYKEHVLRGAIEHGLPPAYISLIECVESVPDPDTSKDCNELSIYN
jgi:cation transport regulator ChaC